MAQLSLTLHSISSCHFGSKDCTESAFLLYLMSLNVIDGSPAILTVLKVLVFATQYVIDGKNWQGLLPDWQALFASD
jgi:DNA polymerase II small subunit/DNA polymerase delta subunit B